MRHDWIDDILAVIDTGSFARAAEMRHVSQSAFARRIEVIETHVGGPLFDRDRKPIALRPEAKALEAALRRTRQADMVLLRDVTEVATGTASLTLACMHAIAATVSPQLVRDLCSAGLEPVRIRSGNRDECLFMLLSGDADLAITFASPDAEQSTDTGFKERIIGTDALLPVAQPGLAIGADGALPVIAYPPDSFLGTIVEGHWRQLADVVLRRRAETALTLAAYRYAMDGMGVAWLPRSLVANDIDSGRLEHVRGIGADLPLEIRAIRRSEPARAVTQQAWQVVVGKASGSERFPERRADGVEPLGRTEQGDGQLRGP